MLVLSGVKYRLVVDNNLDWKPPKMRQETYKTTFDSSFQNGCAAENIFCVCRYLWEGMVLLNSAHLQSTNPGLLPIHMAEGDIWGIGTNLPSRQDPHSECQPKDSACCLVICFPPRLEGWTGSLRICHATTPAFLLHINSLNVHRGRRNKQSFFGSDLSAWCVLSLPVLFLAKEQDLVPATT